MKEETLSTWNKDKFPALRLDCGFIEQEDLTPGDFEPVMSRTFFSLNIAKDYAADLLTVIGYKRPNLTAWVTVFEYSPVTEEFGNPVVTISRGVE